MKKENRVNECKLLADDVIVVIIFIYTLSVFSLVLRSAELLNLKKLDINLRLREFMKPLETLILMSHAKNLINKQE